VRLAIPDFVVFVKDLWKEAGIVDDEKKKELLGK
jgi:hypothetical protein